MAFVASAYSSPVKKATPQCRWCCARYSLLKKSSDGAWQCSETEACIERTCVLMRKIYYIFEAGYRGPFDQNGRPLEPVA